METMTDADYKIETGTLLKILSLIYQQSYGNDMKINEEEMSRSATIYGSDMPSVKHFLLDNKLIKQLKIGSYTWDGAEPDQEMADKFQTYLSTPKTGKKAPEKGEAAEGEQPPEAKEESKKSPASKRGRNWQPEEWLLLSENPDAPRTALAATLNRTKTAIKGALGRLENNLVNLPLLIPQIRNEKINALRKRLNYYVAKEIYWRSSQSYSNLEIDFIKNNIEELGTEKMSAKLKRTPAAISTIKTKVKAGNLEGLKIVEEDEEILAILAMRPVEGEEMEVQYPSPLFSSLEENVEEIERKELSSEEIIPQEEAESESPLELWRVVTAALANMSDAVRRSTDMQKEMEEVQQKRPKKFKLVLLWGLIWYEKSE